jgi:predicted anti-sigma-YlaC factor YlaD
MECNTCQEMLSASLDDELGAEEHAAMLDHLDQCAACQAFADAARDLQRRVRVSPAPAVPDLTGPVMRAVKPSAPSERRLLALRGILVAAALAQLALAAPSLLFGTGDGLPVHQAHHMGAFQLALAVGFAWVALRPRLALAGFLPIATVLVLAGAFRSITDTMHGHTTLANESTHLIAFAGLLAAWLMSTLTRPARRRPHLGLAA